MKTGDNHSVHCFRRRSGVVFRCVAILSVSYTPAIGQAPVTKGNLVELFRLREEEVAVFKVKATTESRFPIFSTPSPPWEYGLRHGTFSFSCEHGNLKLRGDEREADGIVRNVDADYTSGVATVVRSVGNAKWCELEPKARLALPAGVFILNFVVSCQGKPLTEQLERFTIVHDNSNGLCVLETPIESFSEPAEEYKEEVAFDIGRGYAFSRHRYLRRRKDSEWFSVYESVVEEFGEEVNGIVLPRQVAYRDFTGLESGTPALLNEIKLTLTSWELGSSLTDEVRFPEGSYVTDRVTGKDFTAAEISDQEVLDAGSQFSHGESRGLLRRYRSLVLWGSTIFAISLLVYMVTRTKGSSL